MDIKEIALKVASELDFSGPIAISPLPDHLYIDFAEALIAEIAKQNEPCAFLHEWIEYHPFGDTSAGKRCAAITSDEKPFDSSDTVSPLYTVPPTAEQIANETAEACAKACEDVIGNTPHDQRMLAAIDCAVMLRSGAWKEFKK